MDEPLAPELLLDAIRVKAAQGGIASPEFIASLLVDGEDDLAAWAIGQALAEQSRAVVFDGVIRDAMELVGSNWESGRWSVSEEHLATVALTAALARLRPPDQDGAQVGPVAVLAAAEGEQHVAGLACLAQILQERGWRVENLGANVPAQDLAAFVAARSVDLVALSIGTAERLSTLLDAIRLLNDRPDARPPILVGGRGVAGLEDQIVGVDEVSHSLVDSERFIGDLTKRLARDTGPDIPA